VDWLDNRLELVDITWAGEVGLECWELYCDAGFVKDSTECCDWVSGWLEKVTKLD
jgi:hypothetical protein